MGRALGFISILITLAVGAYIYSTQIQGVSKTGGGATPQAAANITGVKNDLISIANAERGYVAQQGKYASLDELISGKYITITGERPPYVYDVSTSSDGFRVTATRNGPGSPAQIWIDQTMEVQTSQ